MILMRKLLALRTTLEGIDGLSGTFMAIQANDTRFRAI